MSLIYSDDQVIERQIILTDVKICKLASKFLDLYSKFKSLTRNEMVPILNEILNEIELIEISILKAENIQKMKQIDKSQNTSITAQIDQNINSILTEISNCNDKLLTSKKNKDYKIHCEEIAKMINNYDTKETLNTKIKSLEKENEKIINKTEKINKKLKEHSNKMALVVSLINDLKNNFDNDIDIDEDRENNK